MINEKWYAKKQGFGRYYFYKAVPVEDISEIQRLKKEGIKIFNTKEEATNECRKLANIGAKEEPKDYIPVSTKLPKDYAIRFKNQCIRLDQTISERLRDLVIKGLNEPDKTFFAGLNKIEYDKTKNLFTWKVQLDSGQEIDVLKNLSLEFLKNVQEKIEGAIKERNQWVHQTKEDSVDIPKELVEGENGH